MKERPPNKEAPKGVTYTVSPNRKIHLTSGIKKIRNAQYFGCDMAGHLIIPSSVIEIGNFAFCCCSKLQSVTIPKSVQTIGISAFAGCKSMKKISIADEVSYIWSNAFEDCTSLREIRLPASLIDIGTGMFRNCSSLKSVTITNSKTLIIDNQVNARAALRNKMFENILLGRENSQSQKDSIMEIKFCYQEMQDMTIFKDCRSLRKIYVPRGSIEFFKRSIPRLMAYMLEELDDI